LRPGRLFAFSIEKHDGEGFVLRKTRRYAHARDYVEALARAHGFEILSVDDAVLRKEGSSDVLGLILVLRAHNA